MPFGPDTTTSEVLEGIDLTGRTALVTGASAGLGVETVRALAGAGARVLGAVRDRAKAERVLDGVAVELVDLDLADLDSVRACAKEVHGLVDSLQLLVNNAGVMACPLSRTAQGFEMQLGTNHLGHFVLTTLLTDLLVAGAPARIVNVSSRGHLRGGIRWQDPHYADESAYEKWRAYGQAKTANVLFTVGLEARLADKGVHSYALHPGVIMTELSRHLTEEDRAGLQSQMRPGGLVLKTPEAGAATQVWAATSPELEGRGGLYLEDCQVAGPTPGDGSGGYALWAMDPDEAERLWLWSEQQVAEVS
jgi:NAD(P)-dependent dehydrogenase (short-subunit alcohol dehydrogenase family)